MTLSSRFRRFFLVFFLVSPHVANLLFATEAPKQSIRGVERQESHIYDPALSLFSWVLYLPRQIVDATLYGGGKTAEVLSDKDFIEKVKDILYIYKRKLLWFPMVGYASGYRITYGGGLLWKDGGFQSLFRGMVHDAHYWSLSLKNTYSKELGWSVWKSSLLGALETKDDRRFYGLGAAPGTDPRNTFLANNDFGAYTEERRKIQWSTGLFTPDEKYGITYLGSIQRKGFDPHGRGEDELSEIFDVSKIPGFSQPVKQLYNELAFEVDTRSNKKQISSGFRGEIYGGFSNGIGGDRSDMFRTGFDAAAFIPVIKEDRVIVPRLTMDLVENLNSTPIPFSEYPRQFHFRGVGGREMIKSDRVSFVPSIEYQWPLSHMLTGSIFFDTIIVGPRFFEPSWHHGIWAAGVGLNIHIKEHEIGRVELAGGSEGFQVAVTLGTPLKSNHRKDW